MKIWQWHERPQVSSFSFHPWLRALHAKQASRAQRERSRGALVLCRQGDLAVNEKPYHDVPVRIRDHRASFISLTDNDFRCCIPGKGTWCCEINLMFISYLWTKHGFMSLHHPASNSWKEGNTCRSSSYTCRSPWPFPLCLTPACDVDTIVHFPETSEKYASLPKAIHSDHGRESDPNVSLHPPHVTTPFFIGSSVWH